MKYPYQCLQVNFSRLHKLEVQYDGFTVHACREDVDELPHSIFTFPDSHCIEGSMCMFGKLVVFVTEDQKRLLAKETIVKFWRRHRRVVLHAHSTKADTVHRRLKTARERNDLALRGLAEFFWHPSVWKPDVDEPEPVKRLKRVTRDEDSRDGDRLRGCVQVRLRLPFRTRNFVYEG